MSTDNSTSKKKIFEIGTYESNLNDVMSNMKRSIGKSLYVASLGRVCNIDTDTRNYTVTMFPILNSDKSTSEQEYTCKALSQFWEITESGSKNTVSAKLSVGDIVLILFLDLNYKDALEYELLYDDAAPVTYIIDDDSLTHKKDYGIIIGKVEC